MAVKQLKKDIIKEKNNYNEAQINLSKGYQTVAQLNSRKEVLEEMKEDFQGFFHGVKHILVAKKDNKLRDIYGAVIELIDVPKEYIIAMETVLGGQAQHIVVKDDQAAREAINWLKKTNNGRATFLPLKSVKGRSLTENVLNKVRDHKGFIGVAASLVKTDDIFKSVIHHLMGHVVIAKTLKDANEIANILMRRNRIVTLDGDVVNPGGSMSGGAKKKVNQSLFTREKDLQEITEKLATYKGKVNSFEQKVMKQKQDIKQLEESLAINEHQINNEQQKLHEIQVSLRKKEMELIALNDNIATQDEDKQQYAEDTNTLRHREKQLKDELNIIKTQLIAIENEINILTKKEEVVKDSREQKLKSIHNHQVELAEVEERTRSQREKTVAIQTQLAELEESYVTNTNDLNTLLDLQQRQEAELEVSEQINVKRLETEKLAGKIQIGRAKRSDLTKRLQDSELELREENKKHQLLIQKIQQKEVKTNRMDVDLDNRLSHLQTEYTITFEKAKQQFEKTTNIEKTALQVKQSKHAISALGTVNMGAIAEYERLSERYTFLKEQKDDLVEAKQTLFSVIEGMDKVMRKKFEETFTQIKKEFTTVFMELFGGGRAELKLTDPENMLDTGVDIIAQPPGKKLQHLGLLSGGERALTAIALLFSILRVRPVPFCILDEVEAALDEANVVRFAKYVRQHSADTQFIVITHRQGTMEEADVLYGVTMQEAGVSRLVSVLLENTRELVNS